MNKITAIVCAYNEERTIEKVVATIADYFFDEVIIVNDGSTDKTDSILKRISKYYSFQHIVLYENKGKGYAMATGLQNATGDIVVFIDADLSNLQEGHFLKLIAPVKNNEADMVLGQPTETLINYHINPFKSFTGQRCLLRKDIMPIVEKMKETRFGVETLINLYYRSEGKKVKYIMLSGLIHPTKFGKTSSSKAMEEFIREGHQIVVTALENYNLVAKTLLKKII
jgi:glycosyltransferase involved in cell wall biosynthesis